MSKEQLIKLGLTDEQATSVLESFVLKSNYEEVTNQLTTAQTTIADRDKQLESLKKLSGDNETLKTQISDLQAENKTKAEQYAKEINELKISTAIDNELSNVKAKNKTAVKALLKDTDKFELDENGGVKGLADQLKSLTEGEDTSFLFDTENGTATNPTLTGYKPAESKDGQAGKSSSNMTYEEAYRRNYKRNSHKQNHNKERKI